MGVDDVGRRWDDGTNVSLYAVAKYADDKFNVLHSTGKRAMNCGKTVTLTVLHAFLPKHSVWVVVSVANRELVAGRLRRLAQLALLSRTYQFG